MKHTFYANLTAHIEINDTDFETILSYFKRHYDGYVNSCADVGGFMYGIKNRRDFSNGEYKGMELTSHKIQSVLKALEYGSINTHKLSSDFLELFKNLQATQEQINISLNVSAVR